MPNNSEIRKKAVTVPKEYLICWHRTLTHSNRSNFFALRLGAKKLI